MSGTRVFRKQCCCIPVRTSLDPSTPSAVFFSVVVAPPKADPLAFSPQAASPSLTSFLHLSSAHANRQSLVTSNLVIPIPIPIFIFIYPKAHLVAASLYKNTSPGSEPTGLLCVIPRQRYSILQVFSLTKIVVCLCTTAYFNL